MKAIRAALAVLAVAALAGTGISASAAVPSAAAQERDIVETAVAAGDFDTLAKLLRRAGLVDALKEPGPYTVFAPTDAAFAKLPKRRLNALKRTPAKLKAVLLSQLLVKVPHIEIEVLLSIQRQHIL